MEMLIHNFLEYLELIGKSKRTISEYALDLRVFLSFFGGQHSPDLALLQSLQRKDIEKYTYYLKNVRQNTAATCCRKISSLKVFYDFLIRENLVHKNPVNDVAKPKKPEKLPKYLTLEQSRILLDVISGKHQSRDLCMLTLLLNCGLRLSELTGLNLGDISSLDTPGQAFMRVWGKGGKERILFLNSACVRAIQQYLPVRKTRDPGETALFLNAFGKRIGNRTVQNMVRSYLQQIGLGKGYSVHTLRHTAATLLYQYSHADILILKNILGHSNVSTTEIYTHLGSHQVRKVLENSPFVTKKE